MQFVIAQEEEVLWNAQERLTWADFKDQPPANDNAAAVTASGITYSFSSLQTKNGIEADFKVMAYFYPYKSWYKPEVCNDLILSHEQLHFDISELYARKFRDILRKKRFTKNIKAEVREIYKQVLKELAMFQDRYDEETNYSRNSEKQLLWNKKVADALK